MHARLRSCQPVLKLGDGKQYTAALLHMHLSGMAAYAPKSNTSLPQRHDCSCRAAAHGMHACHSTAVSWNISCICIVLARLHSCKCQLRAHRACCRTSRTSQVHAASVLPTAEDHRKRMKLPAESALRVLQNKQNIASACGSTSTSMGFANSTVLLNACEGFLTSGELTSSSSSSTPEQVQLKRLNERD